MPPILRGFRVAVPVCVSAAVSFLSLRCRLLDGSHYTRPTYVVQIKSTQTTPKPLQTLAFIGVSQPHDGDEKTADTTATATARHGGCDAQGAAVTATTDATQPRPRRGHDMHGHDRIQRNVPARYHTTRQNTIVQTFQRCAMQQIPPWGSLPPGLSAGAGGTIAEIARGFLKSSRTKRDACNLSSRSAYGLQAFQNQVVQPLLHLFC